MHITSKSQIVFGILASEENVEFVMENKDKLNGIFVYNDMDEGKSKIIGLMVAEQKTEYSFSDAQKFKLLTPEKEKEVFELIETHFKLEASYFLIASCY